MKVKINIELWDDTSTRDLEEIGLTEKFVKRIYEDTVRKLVKAACAPGMQYEMHVEVEDNTIQN